MSIEGEWARMTGPELRELASRPQSLAILPVGSLEQHGPHLPVTTDTASAHAAAVRAARLVANEIPVTVLPGFWLGMSEHHFPFGGTISLDFQTVAALNQSKATNPSAPSSSLRGLHRPIIARYVFLRDISFV